MLQESDVLCLNEHKLQESHVDAMKDELASLLPDYPVSLQHFTAARPKKGYSGVAMLIRKGGSADVGATVTAGYDTPTKSCRPKVVYSRSKPQACRRSWRRTSRTPARS